MLRGPRAWHRPFYPDCFCAKFAGKWDPAETGLFITYQEVTGIVPYVENQVVLHAQRSQNMAVTLFYLNYFCAHFVDKWNRAESGLTY